jgi:hypothetical protein
MRTKTDKLFGKQLTNKEALKLVSLPPAEAKALAQRVLDRTDDNRTGVVRSLDGSVVVNGFQAQLTAALTSARHEKASDEAMPDLSEDELWLSKI